MRHYTGKLGLKFIVYLGSEDPRHKQPTKGSDFYDGGNPKTLPKNKWYFVPADMFGENTGFKEAFSSPTEAEKAADAFEVGFQKVVKIANKIERREGRRLTTFM